MGSIFLSECACNNYEIKYFVCDTYPNARNVLLSPTLRGTYWAKPDTIVPESRLSLVNPVNIQPLNLGRSCNYFSVAEKMVDKLYYFLSD